MWLPHNEPNLVKTGKLKASEICSLGYIRILNDDNESILFIDGEMVVAGWYIDTDSLKEFYEVKAAEAITIKPESKIEIHELNSNLFNDLIELNEECKLSLPVKISYILDKNVLDNEVSREELLAKYRIRDLSENDVDNLIDDYKSMGRIK
ncbi:MAG: hypothetical protein KO217_08950 [Methanobacteriaceae archaeon]|jgi:hypothetical protein|nr:MAG: hypothetical protein CIT01_07395 [Methanobacterium sp. BRmetb2]MCC7558801.1 hypothetical protein [Methanobacteriaceae archaeon]